MDFYAFFSSLSHLARFFCFCFIYRWPFYGAFSIFVMHFSFVRFFSLCFVFDFDRYVIINNKSVDIHRWKEEIVSSDKQQQKRKESKMKTLSERMKEEKNLLDHQMNYDWNTFYSLSIFVFSALDKNTNSANQSDDSSNSIEMKWSI